MLDVRNDCEFTKLFYLYFINTNECRGLETKVFAVIL